MQGWRLERTDQEEVPSVLNAASNTVVADVQELPANVRVLHWVAPPSYLGDRVSSYGGFLTYQIKTFGIPSEGMRLIDRRPDILLTGQEMTLVYQSPQTPPPDRLHQGRVQLVEGNWRHANTNRPVSREELMMALAALRGLRIRALYFTQSQRLSLGEVGLEFAQSTGAGGPASNVERCACPQRYDGDSCQKCAPGFYRDSRGPYIGRCVPCQCNGLSVECEDRTGRCLNCRNDAAGDRCERCKEGYYGNPALSTCQVCPCPFRQPANSFAVGCREISGGFQCICRTGYTGEHCESCAPGYYGDPMARGGSCQPCNCNGNGNSCDSRTGVCKNTLEPKDTNTDENCQECDSCAQTLLNDLEKLDDELSRIKGDLENASASAGAKDRMKKLEKAISDTKVLVDKFSFTINSQKPKVSQLERDVNGLKNEISALKDKADQRATEADKAVADMEKSNERAKTLDVDARNMLKKIQALLDQLKDAGSGSLQPGEDLTKMLADAQRMVDEMAGRNFTPQKNAADTEKDEAMKLLDHIKDDISKQCDKNQEGADRIKGLLKDYEAKLKDLDDALKEAGDLVKKANNLNGLNAQQMGELLTRIEDLRKERDAVQKKIAAAEDQLQNTEDLLKNLIDSKTEYEQLAAQMDGAKGDLMKKVNEISKAAGKEDIVNRAEEHAENLNKMADDLKNAVKGSSDRSDVRDAMAAIEAYKNITEAVKAAEAAANEAKDAAEKALGDVKNADLTKRAKDLKDAGSNLLNDANDAEKDLKDALDDLAEQKKRLKNAEKKKSALEKDLAVAKEELKKIKRDDIADMIDEAKRKTSLANDMTSDTTGKLDAIKDEIKNINVNSTDSTNLDGLMNDVDKSVKDLLNTIPTLEDKISEVEDLSSQLSPISNVSDNIKKIKELIEQARDAANRIVVPMKFKGDGHVELRPPKDLDDLKAYTSLSLSLQRPLTEGRGDGRRRRRQAEDTGDMFVLYLGHRDSTKDYIGMALRKNVLYCVYKLNGVVHEIKTEEITKSHPEPASFDKVDLNRIYDDAELILTKLYTSNKPDPPKDYTRQGRQSKNLLSLSPSDVVFYIGGYPSTFTPPAPLNYPRYRGCIEANSFNERFISLYNFRDKSNINTDPPCKRYTPPMVSNYFEGTGFAKIIIDRVQSRLLPSQTITTRSENGLLLFIGNEEKYYIVAIERGYVVIHSNLLPTPVKSFEKVFPTNTPADVLIIIESEELKVRVSKKEVVKAKAEYNAGEFAEYYLGGMPQELREKYNVTVKPLKACMTTAKLGSTYRPYDEKVGVSRGCPSDFLASRKAEFSLGSSLSDPLTGFSLANDVTVSLGFKSTESEGLLLRNHQAATGIELTLDDGHVVLKFKDQVWRSNKKYQDGHWHYLTTTKRGQSVDLLIDDEDQGQAQSPGTFRATPDTSVYLGKGNFKGCLSNLYVRRPENLYHAEDLSGFSFTGKVLLDVCTADKSPQQILDRNSKRR